MPYNLESIIRLLNRKPSFKGVVSAKFNPRTGHYKIVANFRGDVRVLVEDYSDECIKRLKHIERFGESV